jgi:hypothetical protein
MESELVPVLTACTLPCDAISATNAVLAAALRFLETILVELSSDAPAGNELRKPTDDTDDDVVGSATPKETIVRDGLARREVIPV